MSETAVLKEFLVSLGFKIDPKSQRDFVDAIGAATVKAAALGLVVTTAATAVVAGVAKIADSLEQLYFSSQRTKAAADNIRAFQYAIVNLGGDADSALGSLENMARFLRESPGSEGFLKNLGVQTRDAKGNLRDLVTMMGEAGDKLAGMEYYKANAFAKVLGIDEKTLLALREGLGEFGAEYKAALKAAGLDLGEATKQSHKFMIELRGLISVVTILSQKIASNLMGRMGNGLRQFRELVVGNFDRIIGAISSILEFIARVVGAVGRLAWRVGQGIAVIADWFDGLSDGSKSIIKWLGLVLVAWRVLNAGFLASPIGRVVALATALLALWDDYKTFKEGGESLIDWSKWAPGIEAAIDGIKSVGAAIHEGLSFLGDWRAAFELLLVYVGGSWAFGMLGAVGKVAAGLATPLITALGALATNAALLAAAGAVGYAIGSALYSNFLAGTKAGTALGRFVATALAALGNEDAGQAVRDSDAQEAAKNKAAPASPRAAQPRPVPAIQTPTPAPAPAVQTPGTERGIRNNNPGNIEYGRYARSQGATGVEDKGRFAVFQDAQAGLNALANLLRSYIERGTDSVRAIIAKYAPPGENNTAAYIDTVAKRLGISPDQKLDPRNAAQMAGVIDSVVRVENGRNPYGQEMINKAAAVGTAPVQITQDTKIIVNGSGSPKSVADDVLRGQNDVNERIVRNTRGAVRQ